jgi:anti-anti-sigma factor
VTRGWALEKTDQGVRAYGEIDVAAADGFREELSAALVGSSEPPFVIDLSDVTFMDSRGVFALQGALEAHAGATVVVRPSRQVLRVLEITGLLENPRSNVTVIPPQEQDGSTS